MSPLDQLTLAITAALKASTAVKALCGDPARIYDTVPGNPTYPYIRVGDDQEIGDDNGCARAWECFATLHIFALPTPGLGARGVAKQVGAAVRAALVEDMSPTALTGFVIDLAEHRDFRAYIEADGITAHGVLVVRYLIGEAA